MTWTVHDKEFAAVLSLPPARRYEHFIKKVADWKTMWGLRTDEGWVVGSDDQGHEMMPVWPHERYAAACAVGPWANGQPQPIKLAEWLENWTPGMSRDGLSAAVFPTPEGKWVPVSPERLRDDLDAELSTLVDPTE